MEISVRIWPHFAFRTHIWPLWPEISVFGLSRFSLGLRPGTVLSFNPSSSGSHSTVLVKRVRLLFPLVQLAIAQSLTSPRNLRQMYINRTTRKDSGNYRKGSNRGMVICNGDAAVAIAFCSCSFLFAFCALCQ